MGAFVFSAIGMPQKDAYETHNLWRPDGKKRLILIQEGRVFTTGGREKTTLWANRLPA
jgi:hypothetical protein